MQTILSLLAVASLALSTPTITPYPDAIGNCFDTHDGPHCVANFKWQGGGKLNVSMANVSACNTCAVLSNYTSMPPGFTNTMVPGGSRTPYYNKTAFPDPRGCRLTNCVLYEDRLECNSATC